MNDREYPRHAIVGVGAVVIKDRRILLVRRGYPPGVGRLSIPGGVVEAGESLADAVLRELEEETGLRGRPLGVVHVDQVIVRDEQGHVKYHYVLVDILVDVVGGELRPGGDAVEVLWLPLEEVVRRDDVSTPTKRLVKRFLEGYVVLLPLPP